MLCLRFQGHLKTVHTPRRNRRFTRPSARKNTDRQVNDNVVVNLSSVKLTQPEKALLSRGLGFCPRPKSYDRGKLIEDNLAFNRRLRLKSHFSECVDTRPKETYPDFVLKSDWQPPKQGRDLETFISSVESDITSYTPPKPKNDNLTKADRGALQSLKKETILSKNLQTRVQQWSSRIESTTCQRQRDN